jgi:hypothetical protein
MAGVTTIEANIFIHVQGNTTVEKVDVETLTLFEVESGV